MTRFNPARPRYGVQPPPLTPRESLESPDDRFPWLSKTLIGVGLLLLVVLFWRFCYEAPLTGVGKLPTPIQQKLETPIPLPSLDGFEVLGTHSYDVKAIVLSAKRYDDGTSGKFSPVDFALGWGIVTMKENINKIEWSQRARWFHFRPKASFRLSKELIYINSANTHIIPHIKRPALRKKLLSFSRGDLIHMKGYLVHIKADSGSWRWTSSKSRSDKGGGACEVMYVMEAKRLPLP